MRQYYISQMRPQPPDEDPLPMKVPAWGFYTILALSIFIPWFIWKKTGYKEKYFEGCALTAFWSFVITLVLSNFFLNIGLRGILALVVIGLVIWGVVKFYKK